MVRINGFEGEYRFLSNFYPATIKYHDLTWASVEHAYQAAKTSIPQEVSWIWSAPLPAEAKKRGRKVTIRPDWDKIKLGVMEALVRSKFVQNLNLREQLTATGSAELVEDNWWGDTFWGVYNGKGQNHLGKILMKVRKEIQNG